MYRRLPPIPVRKSDIVGAPSHPPGVGGYASKSSSRTSSLHELKNILTADPDLMVSLNPTEVVGKLRIRSRGCIAGIAVHAADRKSAARCPHPSALIVLPLPTSVKLTPNPAPIIEAVRGSANPCTADLCTEGTNEVWRDQVSVSDGERIHPV